MSIRKYLSGNKIGGLILIIVIIIAFGFGGFGGGFLSNNQNNIAKIDKTNITTKEFIDYINQSGISQKAIQNNLDNNIIEELLTGLVSKTLLDLEIKDFDIQLSKNSLSQKIKLNKNFVNENGIFERMKYEKFLLENNISAPIFEKRLKDRELQKKLFDFIGAGTASPQFLIAKLYKEENRKLNIDFIDLEKFYKNKSQLNNQDLKKFINNNDQLKVEYIDFSYSIINPENLIGIKDFNQEFFDKLDEIENDILNGLSFDTIISKFDLKTNFIDNYRYSNENNTIENKIYKVRNNNFDIFEDGENFIIYEIKNIEKRKPDINDPETKNEITELVIQKNKFDYNKKLLEQIRDEKFTDTTFLQLGEKEIQTLTIKSVKDNKKFTIESIEMLYSMPADSFTLINDDEDKIYLVKIKNFEEINFNKDSEVYKFYIDKETTRIRKSILQSYDNFLNDKYNVNINQLAINNVKNIF
ncbi:SurA N-terminal domain-containing protein [Candidatus Pelagibacter sp.]|nr:SurA N-terminal domain-containing protein [Candidatus Pelagibacter sp.]